MTQTGFCQRACERVRDQLDSYIDNELAAETNLELQAHFEQCAPCTRESEERRNIRARLQQAVRDSKVPVGLEARVREKLEQSRRPHRKKPYLMAIAATLAVCFGLLRMSGGMSPVLRTALDDHIHCAVVHHGADTVAGVNKLPAALRPLVSIARQQVPAGMPLLLAHECGDGGRRFVHLTFGDGRNVLSLIVTRRRDGETLGAGIRSAGAERYQVAGFDVGDYLVYTVSDLPSGLNTQLLTALAPSLRVFLAQIAA